jgi:Resolvase, N terminal domain
VSRHSGSVLVDGYVRVSQVAGRGGERFISPSDQREQIQDWAKLHHAHVVRVFEELDESGARDDRPCFRRRSSGSSRGSRTGSWSRSSIALAVRAEQLSRARQAVYR